MQVVSVALALSIVNALGTITWLAVAHTLAPPAAAGFGAFALLCMAASLVQLLR
jgi:hypothetical protein